MISECSCGVEFGLGMIVGVLVIAIGILIGWSLGVGRG